ncbi:MAG: hypothetical protein OEZ39_10625 [Gammaproteobacteria bacterium]|nr:hypothetical protein [Gammaproteobacteria bacterium]MDH5652297.1 hypothetical protein [Gammaproteobacteria bacterium]
MQLKDFFPVIFLCLCIGPIAPVFAVSIESLVMPGKVIEGHKKYEDECSNCHSVLGKETQNMLCRKCHKEVSADIRNKRGYHGRIFSKQECKDCHTEHKGRKEDIVKLNPNTFNHNDTDFTLKGKHAVTECGTCHKKHKKYREAESRCESCHKKDNPHRGGFSRLKDKQQQCQTCHTSRDWKEIVYDHDKTKFKLTGKHRDTSCTDCHPKNKYVDTTARCYACHKADDVHKNKKRQDCAKCHKPTGWGKMKFDHDKKTEFPLKGRHREVRCDDCHKQDPYRVKIKKACYNCHKNDDRHKGVFGDKCDKCHQSTKWNKGKYNHDRETKFPLRGKHSKARCEDCHTVNAYKEKTSKNCRDCHRKDDVHKGQQGKQCRRCHNEYGWAKKVVFDHDLTKFPLVGLHSALSCEECHLSSRYKDTDKNCNACHKNDDIHKQKLGADCRICHNPNGWRVWRFDHNRQTRFKIDGKHKKLHCHDCHNRPIRDIKTQFSACGDCHGGEDAHDGQFGRDCARCHNTKSFTDVNMRR